MQGDTHPSSKDARELRVAFAYDVCSPYTVGGAETHYRGLTEELASRGHSVTYITSRYWDGEALLPRGGVGLLAVTRRRGPTTGNRSISAALRYAAGLFVHLARHGSGYDVVEVAALPPTAAIAAWLGLLPHRSTLLVTDWHEVWPRSTWVEELGAKGNVGWLLELLARRLGSPVAFSELHANRLPHRAVKIPEFVSVTPPPARQPVSRGDKRVLLCVGRLVANKRFDLLPPTLAELGRLAPQQRWRGLVVGAGPERERIEASASACGVEGLIEFDSNVSDERLSELLSTASVLFHPSRREGFGIILLEASAHGLPSVVCRAPDNAGVELIEAGVNGAIADSADPGALARAVMSLEEGDDPRATTLQWWQTNSPGFSAARAADALELLWAARSGGGAPVEP